MEPARALVSNVTAIADKNFRQDFLKLCFLWFDEILVQTLGAFDEKRFLDGLVKDEVDASKTIHSMSDVILPLNKRIGKEVDADVRKHGERGYPRWGAQCENYTYPDPETPEQFAHNKVLEYLAKRKGVDRFRGHEV